MKNLLIPVFIILSISHSCSQSKNKPNNGNSPSINTTNMSEKIYKSEEEWQKELSPEQYQVLRKKGTERPYTGKYDKFDEPGHYVCAACGNPLFDSDAKFDAGCGWPSFFESLDSTKISTETDFSLGMKRTEIMCARCGGHLGHVFDDGPQPTGLRYCVNSVSIDFKKIKFEKNNSKK